MRIIRQLVATISCLTLLLPLSASTRTFDDAPWYDVEMIIFSHNTPGAGSTEQWSDEPGSPLFEGAFRFPTLQEGAQVAVADTAIAEPDVREGIVLPTARYTLLPESQYRLGKEFKRLKRTRGKIMPLIHVAWRQQVRSRSATVPLHLLSSDQIAPEMPLLEGVLQVSVQRYLHLNSDLILREARDISGSSSGTFAQQSPYRDYRISSHRKMRSGKLHFIDHPKAGILILVSRYELPEVEVLAPKSVDEPVETPAEPAPEAAPLELSPITVE